MQELNEGHGVVRRDRLIGSMGFHGAGGGSSAADVPSASAGMQEFGVVSDNRMVHFDIGQRCKPSSQHKTRFMTTVYRAQIPELGDKFTSPHAQKGVIGRFVSDAEMPYTDSGMRPDVLINPQVRPCRASNIGEADGRT